MALINCPECGKEISDKAKSCPNCGCPIKEASIESAKEKKEPFPDFPAVMDIGTQITNWKLDAAIDGVYFHSENVITKIPEGNVNVLLHTNGICIQKGLSFYYISNQQIINLTITNQERIVSENKSVIGRAVVGGLLLGPLAAIVGGISGLGTKQKLKGKYYLVINYWDVNSRQIQTLLICTKQILDSFIDRYNKEKANNNIPQSSNYVVNILNDDMTINDDRLAQALKLVSTTTILQKIQEVQGCTLSAAGEYVKNVMSKKGLSSTDINNSGCMVMMAIMFSTTIGLLTYLFI